MGRTPTTRHSAQPPHPRGQSRSSEVIKSSQNHRLGWKGLRAHSVLPPLPFPGPGCSKPHPKFLWLVSPPRSVPGARQSPACVQGSSRVSVKLPGCATGLLAFPTLCLWCWECLHRLEPQEHHGHPGWWHCHPPCPLPLWQCQLLFVGPSRAVLLPGNALLSLPSSDPTAGPKAHLFPIRLWLLECWNLSGQSRGEHCRGAMSFSIHAIHLVPITLSST